MKTITELGIVLYINKNKTRIKVLNNIREYYTVYSFQDWKIKKWKSVGGGLYVSF